MAKVLSSILTIARGSVGGLTFTGNQFAQIIMRAKTCPVNPKTTNQSLVRQAMAGAANHWNTIGDLERQKWNDYAATLTFTGPLGEYAVPGRDIMVGNLGFVLYCNNFLGTPLSPDYTGPSGFGFFKFDSIVTADPSSGNTGVALSITNNTGEDAHVLVSRSHAFGPARLRYKGPFLSSTNQFVPVPDSTSVLVEFTGLTAGDYHFMRIRGVSTETEHRLTAEQIFRMQAVTVP
jgi:hypothetical protein